MKSLYTIQSLSEILSRIDKLTPTTTPIWGKMNVAQMMEHCARALDQATGKMKEPRLLIGYLLGSFMKSMYYSDKPWPRNTKTAPSYLVTEQPEFEQAKKRLRELVTEFSEGGPAKATTHPSPFFGHLTPEQHGLGQYKHLDHHLAQFGV
jgi:hypothetical protein